MLNIIILYFQKPKQFLFLMLYELFLKLKLAYLLSLIIFNTYYQKYILFYISCFYNEIIDNIFL